MSQTCTNESEESEMEATGSASSSGTGTVAVGTQETRDGVKLAYPSSRILY